MGHFPRLTASQGLACFLYLLTLPGLLLSQMPPTKGLIQTRMEPWLPNFTVGNKPRLLFPSVSNWEIGVNKNNPGRAINLVESVFSFIYRPFCLWLSYYYIFWRLVGPSPLSSQFLRFELWLAFSHTRFRGRHMGGVCANQDSSSFCS